MGRLFLHLYSALQHMLKVNLTSERGILLGARVLIKVLKDETVVNTLLLSQRLAEQLGVHANKVTVRVGWSRADVRVEVSKIDSRPQRLFFSLNLLQVLHVSEDDYLFAWWDQKEGTVRLGPVMGVMGTRGRDGVGIFGHSTEMIRNCVRVARRKGMLAYAFRPQDIDWESKTVRGWVWTSSVRKRVRCPLPDVVYDRVASRRVEESAAMVKAKEKLLEYADLQYYNRVFLNKWDVHTILVRYPNLKRHLPATEELTEPAVLERYLKRYQTVFVKPTQGSLGAGILRIIRVEKGFTFRITRLGHPDYHGRVASVAGMIKVAQRMLHQGQYIVQRGLRLAHLNGGPFDVRVLLQKSVKNKWFVHSMVARVAQPGNVISNVADGGQIVNPRRAIGAVFGPSIKPSAVTLRIRAIAKAAAQAIEKEMGFDFAEMGLDLAVDTNARIWIIEANSRPGRQTNEEGPRTVPRSLVKLISFLRSRGLQ